MVVGGVDIGSATGKAVIMIDGKIAGSAVLVSTANPARTAEIVMGQALEQAGLSSVEQLEHVICTGYGRLNIPFAKENLSEISCHAKGAHWMVPSIRTVIDVGGQDCKVISLSPKGTVLEFKMNDRCAAGTGRFFEAMARALCCGLDGLSDPEKQGDNPCAISNQCSVFAESEVVTLVNEGITLENIISGINVSVASRLTSMSRRVGIINDVALTGGCSKNHGLVMALEKKIQTKIIALPYDPQIAGALGAAIFAGERREAETAKKCA
jgi:predicted CoA-substrate-specific enzyme activase